MLTGGDSGGDDSGADAYFSDLFGPPFISRPHYWLLLSGPPVQLHAHVFLVTVKLPSKFSFCSYWGSQPFSAELARVQHYYVLLILSVDIRPKT